MNNHIKPTIDQDNGRVTDFTVEPARSKSDTINHYLNTKRYGDLVEERPSSQTRQTAFGYAILVHNNPSLQSVPTYLKNSYKKGEQYALITRVNHADGSETNVSITYSSDKESMVNRLKQYPTYYNYVDGYVKGLGETERKINTN